MLKLNASFSKKIPVPGQDFSSQSYHASVELELSDALAPAELRGRIRDTFSLVRDAVETELQGGAATALPAGVPQQPRVTVTRTAPVPPAQPAPQGQQAQSAAKASNRQIKFITDLAAGQGIDLGELTAQIRKLYNVGSLYDLNRKQASKLLDSLQQHRQAA